MTTACKWDTVIPFEPLWEHFKRVLKPRGAVVLFGNQPFASVAVMSNLEWFRCEIIWKKTIAANFMQVKKYPAKLHENILLFCESGDFVYNPQMRNGKPYTDTTRKRKVGIFGGESRQSESSKTKLPIVNTGSRYPSSICEFSNANNGKSHPTQKPLALLEYLVKTYTDPGMTVLDPTMGSGTTGHACANLDRCFIGIELEPKYFDIAKDRIEQAQREPRQLELIG